MIKLYTRSGCPFCSVVLRTLHARGIPYEERDIGNNKFEQELITRGVKRRVPYLVDDARKKEMSDVQDIMEYLDKHFT